MPGRVIPASYTAGRPLSLGEQTAAVAAPVLVLGTTNETGGTFAASTVYWVLTAINAAGETVKSNEVTATVVLNGSQDLSWSAVTGATGYKLYRGTATGVHNKRVTTLGAVTSHTDTGNAGTTASPPTEDSTTVPIVYALGDTITGAVVKEIKNLSSLLSRRWIIPNVDPHHRRTKLSTPTPTDVCPPAVRKAIT